MKKLLVLALLLRASAEAQELDLFDPNDFIDPRERGAIFHPSGFGTTEPGDQFLLMRAYAGRIVDYQWRNEPTNADLSFVHLTTSLYRGDKQLNAKLTLFDGEDEARLPAYRGRIEFGQYFATRQRGDQRGAMPEESDLRMSGRWLVMVAAEQNTLRRGSPEASRLLYEFGFEADGYIRYRRASVVGSLVWMRRKVAENQVVDRLTYFYRLGERPVGNFRVNASFGVGGERSEGWHWGATRALIVASYDIKALGSTVNLAYGPTYVPGARVRQVYHEVALYFDKTLLARLTPVLRR